jgi:glycosyltransferase involved in cell wall biosynthesis
MIDGRTIAVVMPAFNEDELIGRTLAGIPPEVDHIIVIDDGSTDRTAAVAHGSGRAIDLLTHIVNRGVGAAIATGCIRARELGCDAAVVMAADGQMAPEDFAPMIRALFENETDLLKGNRLSWPGARSAMPLHRWLGNWALSWATRIALGIPVTDSQCGYVALSRRALANVDWNRLWSGYGYPNDLLSLVAERRLRMGEILVRPLYAEEESGIRLRHALIVIPLVLVRAWVRRSIVGAIGPQWLTSTFSTETPTASAPSPSSGTPNPVKVLSSRG